MSFERVVKLLLVLACVACTSVNAGVDERIVGGVAINITDAPYQVSLQHRGRFFCGGSIISPRWILTAAHCTNYFGPAEPLEVRVGSSFHAKEGEIFKVKRFISHPYYKDLKIDYDYSLIELEEPITFDETKQAIQLHGGEEQHLSDKTLCFVSGWGVTQSSYEKNDQLRGVEVPIVSQMKCFRSYLLFFKRITPRMLCAGYYGKGGKDSCQGDSGGPLVTKSKVNGKPTLIGVVSFGIGCATKLFPGVYSRVSAAREWISLQTAIQMVDI